jgi:type I restriction enzyme M protein
VEKLFKYSTFTNFCFVSKPYAGVSTAVLLFTKGGETKNVWFYDMQADGFSLDDKRQKITDNDIPDILKEWKRKEQHTKSKNPKVVCVAADEIRHNKYDLSLSRYKPVEHKTVTYEAPEAADG